MTLSEAKGYYFKYNGHGFHMMREEPQTYSVYKTLQIMPETLKEWDEELLRKNFREMREQPEHAWVYQGEILEIMSRGRCDAEDWTSKLLHAMERMTVLDKHCKILIIENMAGRTEPQKDGGVYFICRNTRLETRMQEVMGKLMDFSCDENDNTEKRGWGDVRGRYLRAVSSYERAVTKFGK